MHGRLQEKIQYDGSLDKLKLIIVVIGVCKNKYMIGDTWYPTESMRIINYLLACSSNSKPRLHQ